VIRCPVASIRQPCRCAWIAWSYWSRETITHSARRAIVCPLAADSYARAARVPYARVPHRTPAGTSLRRAARLISATTSGPARAQITLIIRLSALAEAVANLRHAQRHAAQATAARKAAEHLHAARCAYATQATGLRLRTPAAQIHRDFPVPLTEALAQRPARTLARNPTTPGRSSRRPVQTRLRGPTQ
jgi:hypothetical protein